MKLHELSPAPGSRKKRKRLGRGTSSGHGKTSGKGHKGQNARSGGGVRLGFEGGQTPLFRRLPKRGFTNIHRKEYYEVNLDKLSVFPEGTTITPQVLVEANIIKNTKKSVKILGNGTVAQRIIVKAHKFSENAKSKIEDLGGQVEVI